MLVIPRLACSELPLDDHERNALVCHLDRVGMPQLVRGEPAADPRRRGGMMELLAGYGGLPVPAGGRPVDHAQHRPDRQLTPGLQPWVELAPRPPAHADFTSLAALATPDQDRAADRVEIALLQSKRLTDPEPCPPEQGDQRAQPPPIGTISDGAHHRHDLLDRRRVCRVALALVTRRTTAVVARHGRRRAPVTGGIEQNRLHESLPCRWMLDKPMLYCHREYMSTTKEERLQIRVDPTEKALLERAADASHLNMSAFVVQAAASRAEEVLAERSSIRLSAEASAAFTARQASSTRS